MNTPKTVPPQKKAGLLVTLFMVCAGALPASADPYSDAVLADNPLVYFRFSETSGTSVANAGSVPLTGMASVGTVLVGAPGPGPSNGYEGFTNNTSATIAKGTNIAIGTTSPSALDPSLKTALNGASGITVGLWFNASALTSSGGQALFQIPIAGTSSGQTLSISSTGALVAGGRATSTNSFGSATFAPTLTADTWYNVVTVFNYASQTISLYLNGTQVGSQQTISAWAGSNTFTFGSSPGYLSLGSLDTNFGQSFGGSLDEVAIYNSALSSTDIAAQYAAAVPEPSSMALTGAGLSCIFGFMLRRKRYLAA
ncbi:hypothetical protein BH09VER1_BH09VER1_14070 [soil metagenome]